MRMPVRTSFKILSLLFLFQTTASEASIGSLLCKLRVAVLSGKSRSESRRVRDRRVRVGVEALEERKNPVGLGYGLGETPRQFMQVLVEAKRELAQDMLTENTEIGPLRDLNGQIGTLQNQLWNLNILVSIAQTNQATFQGNLEGDRESVEDEAPWYHSVTQPLLAAISRDVKQVNKENVVIAGLNAKVQNRHTSASARRADLKAIAKDNVLLAKLLQDIQKNQVEIAQATQGSAVDHLASDEQMVAFYGQQVVNYTAQINAINAQLAPLMVQQAPISAAYGDALSDQQENEAAIPYLANALRSSLFTTANIAAIDKSLMDQISALGAKNYADISYVAGSIFGQVVYLGIVDPVITITDVSTDVGPQGFTVFHAVIKPAGNSGAVAIITASYSPTLPNNRNSSIYVSPLSGNFSQIGGIVIDL